MKTYNGWTNFQTWKTNLEFWDGSNIAENSNFDIYELSQNLKELTEEHIYETTNANSFAQSCAVAFLSDVNWVEIAEHLQEN